MGFGFALHVGFLFVILLSSCVSPTHCMTHKERIKLREEVRKMFYHAYDNYMENAFPLDELKPLSCTGRGSEGRGSLDDVLGGFSLTLIDSLDTLVVLEDFEEFEKACRLVIKHVTFNRNVVVSVFETTIRVLGGLLSAHLMSVEHAAQLKKGYNGELLKMATELGNRMLPAFNTPTGIPYSRVNLMMGIPRNEPAETCTAGAGTLLLEFGLLSRLTGNPAYMNAARTAIIELWRRRSSISLVGNVINVVTGQWIRADSSIGAGIDSFFEYLLKGYILFADQELYDILVQAYNAMEKYGKKGPWYVSVHMSNGNVVREWVESLEMFWPGLQVSLGQLVPAAENFNTYFQLWRRYGLPPEAYSIAARAPVPGISGYPLRPELIESAYMLFSATGDHAYLNAGKVMMQNIINFTHVECGFAAVSDVLTKKLEDRFDSFFLSETCKYLYLLFDPESSAKYKDILFTTEGHIVPLNYSYHVPQREVVNTLMCRNPEPPRDAPMFPPTFHAPPQEPQKTKPPAKTATPKPAKAPPTNPMAHQFSSHAGPITEDDLLLEEPARTVVEVQLNGSKVTFLAISANFGPEVSSVLEGRLVYGTPADGCTPLIHPIVPPSSGERIIVLLDRGICMFGEKIRTAMRAGAYAVVVADNVDVPNVYLMTDGLQASGPAITVPSILVNKTMGEQIKSALFDSEEEYTFTIRPARDEEFFAEEAEFYKTQSNMAINIPAGTEWSQQALTDAVMQQLQQMSIAPSPGVFWYIDGNNQPTMLTFNLDPNTQQQTIPYQEVPPLETNENEILYEQHEKKP